MKKGGIVLLVMFGIVFAGYQALSKMTVDINPASIARDMSPEEKSKMCDALSGGTEGGYQICMDGMYLAEQGIQNPVIPDLAQPFEWSNYNPGYTMQERNLWIQKFSSIDPVIGACVFDMLASTIPYEEFKQQSDAIQSGASVESIPKLMMALDDCENGTFHSFADSQYRENLTSTSISYSSPTYGSPSSIFSNGSANSSINILIEQDKPVARSLDEFWVPMLSQKWEGLEADGKTYDQYAVAELDRQLRAQHGAIVIWSGEYTSFFRSDMWVHIVPRKYVTAEEALNWCRSSNLTRANCGAKFLSHTKNSKGTTAWLP
jgi:hypothetical protein